MVYVFCYKSIFAEKATSSAAVKLANVPSSTYSVILTSRALLRSPKRKIDFAASRKPTASMLSVNTKVTISKKTLKLKKGKSKKLTAKAKKGKLKVKNHRKLARSQTDAILDKIGGLTPDMLKRLILLYNQAAMSNNIMQDDEDFAKNSEVTVEMD